ncbi:MAG: TetR/AcrR family transcriptional regulator [Firmicutes bacterium]|nr:TetR/AcrR family transcriptional regulator [Bacillota bacterium]
MKKTSRAEQAEKTRNLIYRTALRMFKEIGYDEVSISQICKEAGVSVGTFYHYFESKEAALMEGYLQFDEQLELFEFRGSPEECIIEITDLLNKSSIEWGSKMLVKAMSVHLRTGGRYVLSDRKINGFLYRLASAGIEDGTYDPSYTPEYISDLLLRTWRGVLFDWSYRGGSYDLCEVSRNDILVVLNGLHTPCAKNFFRPHPTANRFDGERFETDEGTSCGDCRRRCLFLPLRWGQRCVSVFTRTAPRS